MDQSRKCQYCLDDKGVFNLKDNACCRERHFRMTANVSTKLAISELAWIRSKFPDEAEKLSKIPLKRDINHGLNPAVRPARKVKQKTASLF